MSTDNWNPFTWESSLLNAGPGVSSTDRLVGLVIRTFADHDGVCWPSEAAIAEKANLKERAVRYGISSLESAGFIQVVRETGRRNRYQLCATEPRHHMPETPARNAQVIDDTPAPHAGLPRHHVPETPAPRAYKHTNNKPVNKPIAAPMPEKPKRGRETEVDDAFIARMVGEYAPRLGGEERARLEVDMAINHKSSDKAKDKRRHVQNWLRRSVVFAEERRNGQAPQNGRIPVSQTYSDDEYNLLPHERRQLAGRN